MKYIVAVLFVSALAQAKTPRTTSIESLGMGGVNMVVGNDLELLTNPALMERRGSRLSLPGLNLYLTDPREVIGMVNRSKEFFAGFKDRQADSSYVQRFIDSEPEQQVSVRSSLFPALQLSTDFGTFGVGAFGVGEGLGSINPKSLQEMADFYRSVENLQVPSDTSIDVNNLVGLLGAVDVGGVVGYAKQFNVKDTLSISVGAAVRGFDRFAVSFEPSMSLSFDSSLQVQKNVNTDLRLVRGRGYALDSGVLFGFQFIKAGIAVKNVVSNTIKYNDGSTMKDQAQYSVGVVAKPLYFLRFFNGIEAAVEDHYTDGNSTYHAGVQWKMGTTNLNIVPRAGVELGYVDLRGKYYDRVRYDFGLTLDVVALKLSGVYSYDTNHKSEFGAALTFGYEWNKT